jgi:uncharacterized membrane protein YdbT with pleckstrin-like domain
MFMLFLVFCQQICVGLGIKAIATGHLELVFVASIVQQCLWWVNMGFRIDNHKSWKMGVLYALAAATGTVVGAVLR